MLQDKARFTDDLLAKLLAMALNLPTGMGQKLKYGLQKHAENVARWGVPAIFRKLPTSASVLRGIYIILVISYTLSVG